MSQSNDNYEQNKMNLSKEAAQQWLFLCDAVERLKQNPDFKLLVDVYTRSEVMRLSGMLVDQSVTMNKDKAQLVENIIDSIKASSAFRQYVFNDIPMIRSIAEKTINDYNSPEGQAANNTQPSQFQPSMGEAPEPKV